jgi:GAF domain-containing protein
VSIQWDSHLAVPLVGLDEVIGLLFIAQTGRSRYTAADLSMVALVAARLASYLTALREQTERIAAEQALNELRELQDFSERALAHLSVDDLLHESLERVRARLQADAVVLLLPSDDCLTLLERSSLGLEMQPFELPLPTSLAQRLASHEPVDASDLLTLEVACAPIRAVLPSLLGTPLLSRGRLLGLMLVGTFKPGRFAEDDARLLRLFGDRIVQPLEHARLHEEEQRARARTEAVHRRLALLSDVTNVLTASIDYESASQSVARMMVSGMADLCVIDIVDDEGEISLVALAHTDPVREDEVRQARAPHAVSRGAALLVADALHSGRAQVHQPVPDTLLQYLGGHGSPTGMPRTPGYESAIVVPLVARGRSVGAMTFASGAAGRYQSGDVALAEQVARRVALAFENGRLYREAQQAEARYRRLVWKPVGNTQPVSRPAEAWPVTPRERDVLEALVTGASTREIAKQLVISEYAVRYHLRNLFQKLEVHSRSQLVARALQSGLGRSPQT